MPDRGGAESTGDRPDVSDGTHHAEHSTASSRRNRDREERVPRREERGQTRAGEVGREIEQEARKAADQSNAEERHRKSRGDRNPPSTGPVGEATDPRTERDVTDREESEEDAHLECGPAEARRGVGRIARDPSTEAGAQEEVRDEQNEHRPVDERSGLSRARLVDIRDPRGRKPQRSNERHRARRRDGDKGRAQRERCREESADRRTSDVPRRARRRDDAVREGEPRAIGDLCDIEPR